MKGKHLIYAFTSLVMLMLSSCMSMEKMDDQIEETAPELAGTVVSDTKMPIEHLKITASWGPGIEDGVEYTSSEGRFSFEIPAEIIGTESTITLTIEDIDSTENGGEFETLTDQIILFQNVSNEGNGSISLDYQMTRATREENNPQS